MTEFVLLQISAVQHILWVFRSVVVLSGQSFCFLQRVWGGGVQRYGCLRPSLLLLPLPPCQQSAEIQRPVAAQLWARSAMGRHLHRLPGTSSSNTHLALPEVQAASKWGLCLCLDPGVQHQLREVFSCQRLHHGPDPGHPHGPHHLPDPAAGSGLRSAHGRPPEAHRARRPSQGRHLLPSEPGAAGPLLWRNVRREGPDVGQMSINNRHR